MSDSESGPGLAAMRLPLNSRRLTASHLRRLAAELEVPTGASTNEIRQMIDGKLTEAGRDVMNVQEVLVSAQPSCEFHLEDADGKFLTVPEAQPGDDNDHTPSEHPETGEGDTKEALEVLKGENQALLDRLESQLEDEKVRFRELWRTNCQCLAEYDAMVTAKDKEIEELEQQLRGRSGTSPPPGSVESEPHLPSGGGAPGTEEPAHTVVPCMRRGKAPPVDSFTGEDLEVRLDDWLPSKPNCGTGGPRTN